MGLLCTAGLLNGVFGEGVDRHIARWRSVKHVTTFVEQGGDAEIIHHRERWTITIKGWPRVMYDDWPHEGWGGNLEAPLSSILVLRFARVDEGPEAVDGHGHGGVGAFDAPPDDAVQSVHGRAVVVRKIHPGALL